MSLRVYVELDVPSTTAEADMDTTMVHSIHDRLYNEMNQSKQSHSLRVGNWINSWINISYRAQLVFR